MGFVGGAVWVPDEDNGLCVFVWPCGRVSTSNRRDIGGYQLVEGSSNVAAVEEG